MPRVPLASNAFSSPLKIRLTDGSDVVVRRFQADDSTLELTAMLHAAFARLHRLGLNCACVNQTEDVTRTRLAKGDAFVALRDGRLVATVTLCHTDSHATSRHYQHHGVASLRQLGVVPALQGCGLGSALIALGERWAAAHGYGELALDTPKPASHLLAYYAHHGFHGVETLRLEGRNYVSVVLRKKLAPLDSGLGTRQVPRAARSGLAASAGL